VILGLRDQIFRLHGYEVDSTLSLDDGLKLAKTRKYALVIIDVEGDGRIPAAEKLCGEIKKHRPDQEVVFVCNYRVSVLTDCPDEIIRSEFNPQAMIDGVKAIIDAQK
jgi:DNA-binding response OmpR family regulator